MVNVYVEGGASDTTTLGRERYSLGWWDRRLERQQGLINTLVIAFGEATLEINGEITHELL
jgi:hypothetical protein